MFRILLRLTAVCVLVVVGWGSSAAAWDTTAGNDTNYGSITFGSTDTDHGHGVAVDGSGNVYVTGNFEGTVDFGAGNVTSNGSYDVYVTKYNSAGAHQWTTTFGGTGYDHASGVAVDGSGNVYVTGYFNNTVDFGAGNVNAGDDPDAFVTKLNAAGVHQWTNTFGGTGNDIGRGVGVDGSGNVYTSGYFVGTVDFGAGDVTSNGSWDGFVTKYNAAGAHQWTTTFGGTGNSDYSYGLAVDGSGNVYSTGSFRDTVNFGAGNVTSAGDTDVFVTKLNSAGAHQWTTTFGGTDDQSGFAVAVDGSGNVHVTGRFVGTVNFGAGDVTAAGGEDAFVTKLNSSGAHQWTTAFSSTSASRGQSVAVDGSGNVYTTGQFSGTVDFGAGDVTAAGVNTDIYITKLNSSGAHQWTNTYGDSPTDWGLGVALDTAGNVHVTGHFQNTVDFGTGDVTSAGDSDVFVVKLNSAGQAVVAPGGGDGGGGGGGGTPPPPPAPCPWPTATYVTEPACVEPLKGGISVDADGTLFTVGNLDVTGVTIDLEDGETATDIELVSGTTTTGYVLTSKQRIIGFGDTPATDPDGTDLVTLWPGETVTQLSNNRNGTYFATSHGRVFDTNGNPYVDLSRYVTTNNIVDIKTTDSGSGILIGADGSVFNFGVDLFQGSLGGQGVTNIIGGHLVSGGYYLLSATGTIHTFGDIAIAPDITTATTKLFDTDTLNAHIIDVTPAGTGLCALGADGGLFDMLGAQHNAVLRAHTNPNTTAIDTTG